MVDITVPPNQGSDPNKLPWVGLARLLWPESDELFRERGDVQEGVQDLVGAITELFGILSAYFAIAGAGIEPTNRAILYGVNDINPNAIPSQSDLVRLELRDVWRPDVRPTLLAEPASDKFKALMRKQGFGEAFADDIWAAHWSLPSITQAFDMYHRLSRLPKTDPRYFGEEELDRLLKQSDVLNYYRPKLKAIAFDPLTRVDVRRMFQLGVLSKDEVVEAYMQLGYDETNAKRLSDFVEKDVEPDERSLSLQSYQAALREGLITREAFVQALSELGFSTQASGLLVQLEDARAAKLAEKAQDDYNRKLLRYQRRVRRESRTRRLDAELIITEMMDELDITEDDAARFVVFNAVEPKPVEKDLTQAQVIEAVKKEVLPYLEGRALLIAQGLDETEADILLTTKLKSSPKK